MSQNQENFDMSMPADLEAPKLEPIPDLNPPITDFSMDAEMPPPPMDFSNVKPIPLFYYDENTGEFQEVADAFLDPLESQLQQKPVWLISANSTTVAPNLKEKQGHVIVWNKDAQEWEYKEDNRGKTYWTKSGRDIQQHEIKELGPLPEGALLEEPPYEPTPEELADSVRNWRNYKLTEYDNALSQLERGKRLATTEEQTLALNTLLRAWDLYANRLCDIPELDGFPWDGGGEKTPWPQKPTSPSELLKRLGIA